MIPEAAVEAALSEVDRVLNGELAGGAADTLVRVILEAASGHMLADAWNEGYGAAATDAFATSHDFHGILPNPYEAAT